jgi:Glycosyltransferase family 87
MRRRLPIVALVLVLLAELPLLIPPPFGLTDHLLFWYAGHLTATGGSPYDMSAWITAERQYDSEHLRLFIGEGSPVWVYPAWTVLLFVPFGLIPYPAGPWVLYGAYLAVGLFSVVLFIRELPARWRSGAALALPLVALFQPVVIADRFGQFGTFLLLGTVLVYAGLARARTAPLLAGALLLFAKPQLFLVLAPAVLVILVRLNAWRRIGIVAGALVAVAVLTTLRYPESIAEFGRGASARGAAFSQYSTTWAFAHYLVGDAWPILGAAFVVATAAVTIAAIRMLPPDVRVAGIVAGAALLSIVVAPVDFHYDQVPLAAALIVGVAVGRGPVQIAAIWVLGAVVPWFVFFIELSVGGPNSQSLSGVVPLLIAPMLWLATWSSSPAMTASSPARANTAAKLK